MSRFMFVVTALALVGCKTQLHHALEERDANEIVSVLTARGIEAQKLPEKGKKPTWSIEVSDARATDALRVLTELKLPRAPRTTTRDLSGQVGLIETPSAERMRQLEAQEGDLEQTLETIDGVVSASVELVVPMAPRPGQAPVPSKASVLLRTQSSAIERVEQQRAELRALVAAGVDGLKADDVVLLVDEVVPQVVAAPVVLNANLKPLVMVLGGIISVLAVLLIVLTLRLNQARAKIVRSTVPHAAASQPPTAKPQVAPAVQRKVA